MACVHEFGIIDVFDKQGNYQEYNPDTYNCISVHDDIIASMANELAGMKTYFHSLDRPEFGLAYCGITIIPPDSLSLFYDVVSASRYFKKSTNLAELAAKIIQASKEKKYMIHYGV
ncbi:short-chain dehydrogenase [Neobacillus piezotolerans]|uniref:Short-chain dehydrogenase n=1 Tax=Neobacillus piezotolerans TaxID=2259171 RepID=A0A3D8GTN1_9BACI|nr:short-chain dehydrogenase [Neobacillus piezotolerans]RDU37830.1 short-chain dehydrogenase [Neobacillus piezotolerans]